MPMSPWIYVGVQTVTFKVFADNKINMTQYLYWEGWKTLQKNKGVTHNTHMRNVKKFENSSIDLLRGRNSWSKSCKFHCCINFADKKGFPNIIRLHLLAS